MRKFIDYLMWLMFAISLVISILTMLVVFGIVYIGRFSTFLPLEICLSITFFLWGINSTYNSYTRNGKYTAYYYIVMGGMLLAFAALKIY